MEATANGVIKVLSEDDRPYVTADQVQKLLGVGRSKSYGIIASLRQEMIDNGILTKDYPHGKIPKGYFQQRCAIERSD